MSHFLRVVLSFLSFPFAFGQAYRGSSDCQKAFKTLDVHFSSLGLGLGTQYEPCKPYTLSLGLHFFSYEKPFSFVINSDSEVILAPRLRLVALELGLEARFKSKSPFFGKASLIFSPFDQYQASVSTLTGVKVDGLEISAQDFGEVVVGIDWHRIRPLLAIGIKPRKERHLFYVKALLGVLYVGPPRLQLQLDGFLETTNLQEELPKIQHNLRYYQVLPYVSLQGVYHFSKRKTL